MITLQILSYSIEYFHARVKKEIESWPAGILADYAHVLELLMEFGPNLRMPRTPSLWPRQRKKFGPNLRMPHSRAMGDGLFELRARGREGIGRAFYCFVVGRRFVILHGFIKKTEDTPAKELQIARRRMKEVQND